ncbi:MULTISPECIES: TfoX/Sxy family protein [unclassified Microbacterium]|uniref:TfoX/Sxy family protein n=1 Tax=unclassified Microbacterium TaxID=2609290 RepID=UPI0030178A76
MTEDPRAVFDDIAAEYMVLPGVDIGPMFGSEGLRIRGKVFAFLASGQSLIAKLPEARVSEFDASGRAERMTMRDRAMREWVLVGPDALDLWPTVIAEAFSFVDDITPR